MAAVAFVLVVLGLGVFLICVKINTAAEKAKGRRILARPESGATASPEEIDRLVWMLREDNARRAHLTAAANGQLPDYRRSSGQRIGSIITYGVLAKGAWDLTHRDHDADDFRPWF